MSYLAKFSFMLLGHLKFFHKFVMIIMIMLIVLIIFLSQLAFQSLSLINFSKKELLGVDYLSSVIKVSQNIQNFQYEELHYLLDEKNGTDRLVKAQNDTDASIQAMDMKNNNFGLALKTTHDWNELKSEWEMIKQSRVIDPAKSNFDNVSMVIKNLDEFIGHVCDASNITLDPEILTYYLGDTYCTKLPTYISELSLIRSISDKGFATNALSHDDHKLLLINENLMDNYNKLAIKDNLDKITVHLENSNYLGVLSINLVNTLVSETTNLVSLLNGSLLAEPLNTTSVIQPSRYVNLLNVAYNLNGQVQDVLKLSLQARINKIYGRFYFNLTISVFALLLMTYLFMGIYQSIIRNSSKLLQHAKKMEEGDFHHIINIKTQDEMAKAAGHLDNMRHSFFLIAHEMNVVLEKIVTGKEVGARVQLKCEGLFDKLETNINALADLTENLLQHVNKLIHGAHVENISVNVASLENITEQSGDLIQRSAKIIHLSQEDIQPYYKQINELLNELKIYYRDEHEVLRGDVHTLEDIVLQMRILSLNMASLAEKKHSTDSQDEMIRFATEVRTLAENIFGLSHMIKTVEIAAEKQKGISATLIAVVNACNTTWSSSLKKLSSLMKELLVDVEKQKHDLTRLDQAQKQLHKITDEAKEVFTNHHTKADKK